MSLWDISDGRCIEHTKLALTHTFMRSYQLLSAPNEVSLFCCGYYPEIQVGKSDLEYQRKMKEEGIANYSRM